MAKNPLQEMLEAAERRQLMGQSVAAYILTFHEAMKQKKVNLEAAIQMTKTLVEKDEELDPSPPEIKELVTEAFDIAADKMRNALASAYRLVELNDNGSTEPAPYDEAEHLAAREEELTRMREAGLL